MMYLKFQDQISPVYWLSPCLIGVLFLRKQKKSKSIFISYVVHKRAKDRNACFSTMLIIPHREETPRLFL